jgi:hypothetical protein
LSYLLRQLRGLSERHRGAEIAVTGRSHPEHWHAFGDPGEPTLQGGWESFMRANYAPPGFRKADGFLELRGHIYHDTAASSLIAVLPFGYRPVHVRVAWTLSTPTGDRDYLAITPAGQVYYGQQSGQHQTVITLESTRVRLR